MNCIQSSDKVEQISSAFVKAQLEVHSARANAKNPHFRSEYADITAIRGAVRDACSKHRLALLQVPGMADDGRVTLTGRLIHESGEWLEFESSAKPVKADPQGVGSCITYLRRYQMAAVFGVVTGEEDDDGQAASRGPSAEDASGSRSIAADFIARFDILSSLDEWKSLSNELKNGAAAKLLPEHLQQVRGAAASAKKALEETAQ